MSVLCDKHFNDEAAAYRFIEAGIWPEGRVCPHCGTVDHSGKLAGKSTRIGVYKCYDRRKPFTAKVGTIFESSHIKLHIWLQAIFLICASKKGISSNQLHRILGITLKSAWFMSHRIREAMKDGSLDRLGGEGKTIEADETYIGGKQRGRNLQGSRYGIADKMKVVALIERGGRARSIHVADVSREVVTQILDKHADRASHFMTDEAKHYRRVGKEFASHGRIHHAIGQYGKPGGINTNTIEGYFSIFKRGMKGIYQHCSERHLQRYLAEFDFRYNNRSSLGIEDIERAARTLRGIVGKRLTYRATDSRIGME